MHVIDLLTSSPAHHEAAAIILMEAFRETSPNSWRELESAWEEVVEFLSPDRIARLALDERNQVLGWIGGNPLYDGNVWELHPLAVHPRYQGQGVGRALVQDFEQQVYQRGGSTIFLGTDDEIGSTSLANVDLYPDVWTHLRAIRSLRRHPFEFYQKLGFIITGVIPDANGPGRPDILMCKRVTPPAAQPHS
jgi:aminoglycoside 6'-N-acetyltransferase I